ncbi:sugar phosphate isomerase/epimerase family protein [Nonomuraea sp. NPDC049269]|uniref:sugar phosphate isomerase/epimerase family protein n=1 Tax=Nonomuraea sp. NPDC049269 TaxID=3364349 RepID=UPI00371BE045
MPYLTFPTVNCLRMPDRAGGEPTVLVKLERILAGVAEAGHSHVSVDGFTVGGYDHDRLAALLSRYGLECSDVGVLRIGEPAATVAAARTLADRARAVGARICVTAVDTDPAADGTRELLAHCADLLGEVGVRLALEFLPYTGLATLAQARELCAAVGWLRCGMLVDSWMFFRGPNSWDDLEGLTADQVAYVQIDDAPEAVGSDPVFESRHRRVLPGQGAFDLRTFVAVLERIGFDGPVSVEVLSDRFRDLEPVEQGRAAAVAARDIWPRLFHQDRSAGDPA